MVGMERRDYGRYGEVRTMYTEDGREGSGSAEVSVL
jgi:hypothetical protein